jgi:kinesin family protein 18/19
LEIYNENIRDLLSQKNNNLELKEDSNKGVIVNNIIAVPAKTADEILSYLKIGNHNRASESTLANLKSSRSHAIIEVQIVWFL